MENIKTSIDGNAVDNTTEKISVKSKGIEITVNDKRLSAALGAIMGKSGQNGNGDVPKKVIIKAKNKAHAIEICKILKDIVKKK